MATIQDSQLASYRTDGLILLVGSNPLPNAVAAELLYKPGGEIQLIVTQKTANIIAPNLSRHIQQRTDIASKPAEVDESNAANIYSQVYQTACKLSQRGKRVGLNYTGGTKVMAVHAHQAVRAATESAALKPVFSYLDARSLELRFDPLDIAHGGLGTSVPVMGAVKLTIEELGRLHDWSLKVKRDEGQWSATFPLLPTAMALSKIHQSKEAAIAWRSWCKKVLEGECQRKPGTWKSSPQLRAMHIDWPGGDLLAEPRQALQSLVP